MTKRGVPGVWTYGFYDGWVPNYMFFIAHSHNAIGRFYEVASYGPDLREQTAAAVTSREWFRPNPPLPTIKWGPRNNTNIQQSALLIALNHVGEEQGHVSRELLAQEQAGGRQGQERADLRLGDSRRPATEAGRRRCGQRAAPAGSRSAPRDRRVQGRRRRASRRATTSSAAISRIARSPTCTSRCRTTRRRTRARTTTPAGRSRTCATWSSSRSPTKRCSTAPRRSSRPTPRRRAASRAPGRWWSSITRPTTSLMKFRFKHAT